MIRGLHESVKHVIKLEHKCDKNYSRVEPKYTQYK